MQIGFEILLLLFSYLLGSIPFGYIFIKQFTGKNILELGSGNIGSTNVRRIGGKKISILTQLCDMLKGLLPVALVYFLQRFNVISFEKYFIYLVGLFAIIGHNFSIFLKFKGGKGVNTTLGASVLLAPISVFISVFIYFIVKWTSKYVSLGSICLAVSLPITDLIINGITVQFYYLLICSALIIVLHIPNIKRLLNGVENKL